MFEDRVDAGRQLAERLRDHPAVQGQEVVVLGLPRGGVPVAAEVAQELGAPLDVIVVRKLGVPDHPELAMGAIGEGGVRIVDDRTVRMLRISPSQVADVVAHERGELDRRAARYRDGRRRASVAGKVAVVVDDGVATGSTARAACRIAHALGAARVVLAVPVAPEDWVERLHGVADDLVAVEAPAGFFAVGQWYRDFSPTSDDEVVRCLRGAATARERSTVAVEVDLPVTGAVLAGDLVLPPDPLGLVVFAHGSGSSRRSPRNREVARDLVAAGFGVLLFDLLTAAEGRDRTNVFDVELLGGRLTEVVRWVQRQEGTHDLPVGCFGASTGAAAALWTAAAHDVDVRAVVSRGGRPDLAGHRLAEVTCPVLLIVGERDEQVLELNRRAQARLHGDTRLAVVPGATHLFEEPGALDEVTHLATSWFYEQLGTRRAPQMVCG